MQEIHGDLDGRGKRFALVVSRFNALVTEPLLDGAVDILVRHGADRGDLSVIRTPGAYELPLACKIAAESGRYDGVVALGAVIRGSTPHFDYVCAQAARGLLDASTLTSVPVGFGLLTCDTLDQAFERAGSKAGNKGAEAALATLEMVGLCRALRPS